MGQFKLYKPLANLLSRHLLFLFFFYSCNYLNIAFKVPLLLTLYFSYLNGFYAFNTKAL